MFLVLMDQDLDSTAAPHCYTVKARDINRIEQQPVLEHIPMPAMARMSTKVRPSKVHRP